jgi:NAD(P)-dependent dehydrogenase (short-subunit alcohol dehydrogenase family)
MDLGLNGKVAVITGGSQGIGRATAVAFAREGARVAICARGEDALNEAAKAVQNAGGEVLAEKADVTVPADIERFIGGAAQRFGAINVLVNNAVSFAVAGFGELPDEAWQHHFNVKLLGYVRCARAALPHLRTAGGGHIINVAGIAARHITGPGMTAGAINAAIVNFTKSLADQVAAAGILVNAVHPGATRTHRHELIIERMIKDHGITREEAEERSRSAIPIGRLIEPEDIADLIVFLSSARATAITGQTIAVEGGATRGVFY